VTGRPDDPERTREIKLPPVPARPPQDENAADQPTDQLAPPEARQPTGRYGPWQPLQPRVVPRRRSRTPYVVTALVVLILAVGVVAVLVWG
jgi:hypothetical protein